MKAFVRTACLVLMTAAWVAAVACLGVSGGVAGCGGGSDATIADDGTGGADGEPTPTEEGGGEDDGDAGDGGTPAQPVCETHFSLELDPSFGADGLFTHDFGGKADLGNAVVVQPDGKALVSGYVNWTGVHAHDADLAVLRLDADGALDAGFGAGGVAVLGDCDSFWGVQWWAQQGLALQSDGKVLVGGDCQMRARTYRLNADGTPDLAFNAAGTPGYVEIEHDVAGGNWSAVFSLALQPDGAGGEKIVVGGIANRIDSWDVEPVWVLARYDAGGALDATFGDQPAHPGIVIEDFGTAHNDGVRDLIVLPDRRIIAYGNTSHPDAGLNVDFAVARYDADGAPDVSFGAGGMTAIDFGGMDWAYPIALAPDGGIVGGAHVGCCGDTSDTGLFRLDANGAFDASFGEGGVLTQDVGAGRADFGNAVYVLPDESVLVGGRVSDGTDESADFFVAMFDGGGALAPDFGAAGIVRTDFYGDADALNGMAVYDVATDGADALDSFRAIAAGTAVTPPNADQDFAVARYRSVAVESCPR